MTLSARFACPRTASFAIACLCALPAPVAAHAAGAASTGDAIPGATPFIATIPATISGATLASVTTGILSRPGSLVLPLIARYSAKYLAAHDDLSGNSVTVPLWGLYAGTSNTVATLFSFTDGSSAAVIQPVGTAAYVDPCAPINAPVLRQHRASVSDLGFNYFLLKDYCSKNSPAIVDTDGHLRWTGTANVKSLPSIFYDNAIYLSDGRTGIDRIEMTGQVSHLADYAARGVTSTSQHNMDRGRNGIVVEIDTKTETQGAALEFNPATGAVLEMWDMADILSAAMIAGGDDPREFVGPLGTDWFHMNATSYDPADNTEIISSRENFVIDVDHDLPADGVRKIHWILGDPTKKWHQFPSLAKYALHLAPHTLPPIGQHAVSIDLKGNLLLFDDGNASLYEKPAGLQRGYSAGRSYKIDTRAMTATEVFDYTPVPHIYASFCGSIYQASPDSYLIDFATADNDAHADIQGLGANHKVVFDLQFGQSAFCGAGWNAFPLPDTPISFD